MTAIVGGRKLWGGPAEGLLSPQKGAGGRGRTGGGAGDEGRASD